MSSDLKRSLDSAQEDESKLKKAKEAVDVPLLLQEQPENTLESRDLLIQKLKSALQETYGTLCSWKEACPDFDASTVKIELSSMKTLKAQLQEARKRDRSLVMRLSTKEQEIHDLQIQVNDFRQALSPHTKQIVGTLFDPAVNMYVLKLREDIKNLEKKLKQTQDDLEAQRFTPHSITGRKLMAKCRALQDENEELGRQISEGQLHKLSQETALQREYSEELKSSLNEANDFVLQLDEETEVLQQTVLTLQRQLKEYQRAVPILKQQLKETKGREAKWMKDGQGRTQETSTAGAS